ncbi:transglycosylase domain-containing protein [Kineosporia babensis]|uniref:Penicillin-binding protein n=1 Tax=Kineosporia babensis TaxID=499548 RepID=A0A9X1STN0_9ACTN|nr:transglycosylase domain-containing protein [Kineosporia babensis]MCD5312099.1 penicillin-binding protein [Kineosporia babensis]
MPSALPGRLSVFVATSVIGGLLAAGLAVPLVGAGGLASNQVVSAFQDLPSEIADTTMSANTTVLAADGSTIATFYDQNRVPVELDEMSPYLQDAIVAIEDERFYEHGGVDPQGLVRALVTNELSGGVSQGASTLTQQLVKNLLKEAAYQAGDEDAYEAAQEQTNERKLKEIRLAGALEQKLSKSEILQEYLNIAWFGGQVNGVEAAARYYFDSTAADLTLAQAATLAGMVQSPTKYDLKTKAGRASAQERRDTVLKKMFQQGLIDQAELDEASAAKLTVDITPTLQGCANAGTGAYFCDYVYNLIVKSDDFAALGSSQEARATALKQGGYTIRTTLDPDILDAAWTSVTEAVPADDSSRVAAASVTVEPGTGKVLSMIQNKYYSVAEGGENTTINYSTDYAYGGSSGFQTGSTFKPVVLAAWLKAGHTLEETISGAPVTLSNSSFQTCADVSLTGTWTVNNAGDSEGSGSMTVAQATAQSVNGAYARMEQQLDLCDVQKTAQELGMHLAQPAADQCIQGNLYKDDPETTTEIPNCVPSVVLGVASQSPLTMANAYATFASGGVYCNPVVVDSVTDRDGNQLDVPQADCKQSLDADVAAATTEGLSKVFTSGTASSTGPLSSGQPASGKTGTTNNSQDTWFVGYTPQLATSVWVGPETVDGSRDDMRGVTINGSYYSNVYGGTIAAPIWKRIMTSALAGTSVEQF